MEKKIKIYLVVFFILCFVVFFILFNKKIEQKEIVAKNKNIIVENNLKFKDLNNNQKLDKYEDWRLTNEERVEDLVKQMKLEEKVGMMVINTQLTGNDENILDEIEKPNNADSYVSYSTNTRTIEELNIRHIISRQNIEANKLAKWNNALNEIAEKTRLGIPVLITSNPRNHSSEELVNTIYPSTLGIAAAGLGEQKEKGTLNVVENFAKIVREEFKASGIRKGYMYSVDIMTDARWYRNNETFGENVDFVSKVAEILVKTIQGENSLNSNGVSLTMKHFPGSGARKNGHDSHFEAGKYSPYVTENSIEKYHLKSFQTAINNKVSSIMPYYSQPDPNSAKQTYNGKTINMTGTSFTYNEEFLKELLRNNMGFEGYINTDSGVINFVSWGEEEKTNVEKVAKAINTGVDLISDTNHTDWIMQAVEQGLVKEERINESVKKLLKEMFQLGLFENPYVDEENALTIVANEDYLNEAYEAHQKSVVVLKNQENALPIKEKTKIYIKEYGTDKKIIEEAIDNYNFEITQDYKKADYFITYLQGEVTKDMVYNLNLKDVLGNKYEEWINIGNSIKNNGGKRITIINMDTAYILDGIEQYSDGIVVGFDTYMSAILDVMIGKYNPVGVLPFTLPASDKVLEIDENGSCISPNDVPGYDKTKYMSNGLKYEYIDKDGNVYKCGFGLTY